MKRLCITLLGLVATLSASGIARAGGIDTTGNVFVAIGNGLVEEYTPNGTPVQTLNDGTGAQFTTGMAFDSSGNLLVTNFTNASQVSLIGANGVLINSALVTGQSNAESIAISSTGNLYIGAADLHVSGANGTGVINEYPSTGGVAVGGISPFGSTSALTEDRGTDWIDLQANQNTVLYTSEGTSILSVNTVSNTQNGAFATSLPGSFAYALREIPTGTFAGDVVVADSSAALLLNSSGAVVQTYTLPGNSGSDFALNLDPNGTAFWTADLGTGTVWEVNIADGTILQQWNANAATFGGTEAAGLVVFGQITSSGGGGGTNPTPEPGTLVLFASGLLAFAAIGGLTKFRLPQATSLR